jgi:HEAT repeat protein
MNGYKKFKDPDWQMRQYAVSHISEFGIASVSAMDSLRDSLGDENERVRVNAKRAIEEIEKIQKKTK